MSAATKGNGRQDRFMNYLFSVRKEAHTNSASVMPT